MTELGYTSGIENYSRYLSGRAPGEPPPTLLDYLPSGALMFIDESHVSIPQIGGMYRGDRSRKETLVEFGFRLPSALDNRPLRFDEFEQLMPQTVFVSATPAQYEADHSQIVVEQVVRPTGLVDPVVEVRPVATQVDDLLSEIQASAEKGEHHYEFVINTIRAAMENTHWPTFGMALIAFSIMYGVRRYKPRLPSVLMAVIVTTVLAWLFGFAQHSTINLDQITDQKIRIALVYDAIQTKHISNLREKYISAQQEYAAMAGDTEQENETLMASRQQLEQIAFRLEQLNEEGRIHHEELYATSLYSVGRGDQRKFYTRDQIRNTVGETTKIYGQDWHITNYENDIVELQAGGKVIGKIPSGLPGFKMPF